MLLSVAVHASRCVVYSSVLHTGHTDCVDNDKCVFMFHVSAWLGVFRCKPPAAGCFLMYTSSGANIFAVTLHSVLAANIHFIPATEKLVVEGGRLMHALQQSLIIAYNILLIAKLAHLVLDRYHSINEQKVRWTNLNVRELHLPCWIATNVH